MPDSLTGMTDLSVETERIAIAVVCWNDHFLVGKRPEGIPFGGFSEFPGGRVEPGETWEEAARRETLEETGIVVQVGALLDAVALSHENRILELRFFAARPVLSPGTPRESFRWIPRATLRAEDFPPANRRVVERIIDGDDSQIV